MSARLGFVEARARLADKQAAKLRAKDEARQKAKLLKVFGIEEPNPNMSVPATEAGSSWMASQTQRQDCLAAPTRDAETTMGTLVRPELDCTPQTLQERERVDACFRNENGSASLNDALSPKTCLSRNDYPA